MMGVFVIYIFIKIKIFTSIRVKVFSPFKFYPSLSFYKEMCIKKNKLLGFGSKIGYINMSFESVGKGLLYLN